MVRDASKSPPPHRPTPRVLIVGNYTHDVIFRNDAVVSESIGGAVSFISVVLDGLSIPFLSISKVGHDFQYFTSVPPHHLRPIIAPNSKTTLFHAYFNSNCDGCDDRVLKRVCACDPIFPSDLPEGSRFDFGMAVGVGGEILPETLEKMIEICDVVFVDIQALIREFDPDDGRVRLAKLKDSGFYELIEKVGFLKASAEEAECMEVEEVRRRKCCVVVTEGKEGCSVCMEGGEVTVSPFEENEVDPTGAGDSFLGGLVAGVVEGLNVCDAAILGNLFGALTVGQVGLPKFESRLLQVCL